MKKTILITGIAGFIGYSLANYLSKTQKYQIVGLDNLNDYYDVELKNSRLKNLGSDISFFELDINDDLDHIFKRYNFDCVINLAAQAGVRYAKKNPNSYIHSNVNGFYNILRQCQMNKVDKILFASSSSVYGSNIKLPFSESDPVNTPMSIYAATKKSNEDLASGFFYSYGMRTIGLRFFNVYGPFGRPDMAYFKWTQKIINNEEIEVNNNGEMWRDMTYITDCVRSIQMLIDDDCAEDYPEIYNIGNRTPVKIADMLSFISATLNVQPKAKITQAGQEEPIKTWADTKRLESKIGFAPNTDYRQGLKKFIDWYKGYYAG